MLQKQTKTILCVALFFIAQTTTAQVTNFKLSDFKYRTNGFKALGFQGSGGANKYPGGTNGSNKNTAFNIIPNLTYMHNYSTNSKQLNILASSSSYFTGTREKDANKITKQSITTTNGILKIDEKKYKKNYFINYGGDGSFLFQNDLKKNNTSNKKVTNELSRYAASPYVGIGKGRIENVSNAQMAMFILEDLYKAGKIKNKVSSENTMAFANLITQVYNRRVFDFRKRRMYEIEQIDSFLVVNKILVVNDVKAINIISDNWSFAIQPGRTETRTFNYSLGAGVGNSSSEDLIDTYFTDGILEQSARFSGRQIYVRLSPVINHQFSSYKDSVGNNKAGRDIKAIDLSLNYDNYKPINVKWGWHQRGKIIYSKGKTTNQQTSINFKKEFDYSGINGIIEAGIGYYPNSRTVLEANWNLSARKSANEFIYNFLTEEKYSYAGTAINLTTSYFLSYTSRLTGSFSLGFYKENSNPIRFASNFNIGYNVYIF
jgi:hypothetical protein